MSNNLILNNKIESIKEIFEALPSGVITFNENSEVKYFNRNFITLFFKELNPRKFTRIVDKDGLTIKDLISFKDSDNNPLAVIDDLNSGSKTIDQIYLYNILNGEKFQIILTLVPHFDEETYLGSTLIISNMSDYYSIQTKYGITKEESIKDGLTELYNKKYLYSFISDELQKIKKDDTLFFSIVMMDIDNFKNVNDTYGHLAGDEVLKVLSNNLKGKIRQNDLAARFGGEEFVLVLTGTKMMSTLMITERVRESMEASDFSHLGIDKPITISLGVFNVSGKDYQEVTVDETLEKSDRALYHSKENGKNQVSVYLNEEIYTKSQIQDMYNDGIILG